MNVTGWSNGHPNPATGSGYGVRIATPDRDAHSRRRWSRVVVRMEGGESVRVTLSPSFWRRCSELRSAKIGLWMLDHGVAPWPKGRPPELVLEPTAEAEFSLSTA